MKIQAMETGMKKYSFSMTKKEIVEFSVRVALVEMCSLFAIVLFAVAIVLAIRILFSFSLKPVIEFAKWVMEVLAIPWLGIILAAFILGLIIAVLYQNYDLNKKNLYGKTRTMWLEDDLLKVNDGDVYREIPFHNICVVIKNKKLIAIGVYQAERRLLWYSIPLRVFSDGQEIFELLKNIRSSGVPSWKKDYNKNLLGRRFGFGFGKSYVQNDYTMSVEDEEDAGESSLYKFSYWIDEERWKRALIDTKGIIRSGVLGSYKKNKIILAVFAIDFSIFICGCIFKINYWIIFLIFITLIFLLNLASNNMVNPEKVIRSQWKEGLMQNEDYGKWKVSLSETGVTCDKPNLGRTRMSWRKFLCMVETNTAFYLFLTDKKHFVMILKECIGSREQVAALKQLCAEKSIAVTMSIKVKYVPYWVFTLLLAVLIFICLFLLACGII